MAPRLPAKEISDALPPAERRGFIQGYACGLLECLTDCQAEDVSDLLRQNGYTSGELKAAGVGPKELAALRRLLVHSPPRMK